VSDELVVYEPQQPQALTVFGTDDPGAIVQRVTAIAQPLAAFIKQQQMSFRISGREYVLAEGWSFMGAMLGVAPRTTAVHELRDAEGRVCGFEANVELLTRDGAVVGGAIAECSRYESNWTDRDDFALKSMAQCVPLRAEILTRDGFRRYDQISEGDHVLAYSTEADRCEWVPVQAVSVFNAAAMIRMQSRSLDVLCTPDHSWAVRRTRGASRMPYQTLVEARSLRPSDSLVVAAESPSGDSRITPREAAILGWLITDGSFRYVNERLRGHIDQSNPKYLPEIRELVGTDATSETITTPDPEHLAPNGRPWGLRDSHRFSLSMPFMRDLFGRAGVTTKADFPGLATRLSAPARDAMWLAMLHADGSEFRPGLWRFGKLDPHTMETFQVLAALKGVALGKQHARTDVALHTTRRNRLLTASHIRSSEADPEPVWCPTTPLGTWVMRLDGNVLITGNTRATGKAYRMAFGFVMKAAGYEATPAEEMPADDARPRQDRPARTPNPPIARNDQRFAWRDSLQRAMAEHEVTGDDLERFLGELPSAGRIQQWLDDNPAKNVIVLVEECAAAKAGAEAAVLTGEVIE